MAKEAVWSALSKPSEMNMRLPSLSATSYATTCCQLTNVKVRPLRAKQVKGILTVELNAGQMVEDVRLAVECKVPVEHFGRLGGIVPDPDEVVEALKTKLIK